MSGDSFVRDVKRLGHVPFCVRDAFSWLPHPGGNTGTRKHPQYNWYWVKQGDSAPAKLPCGQRCHNCIFQEPTWAQGHAGCTMSWLNDDDGDCRAFISREQIREVHGTKFDDTCVPMFPFEGIDDATCERLANSPYWSDSTTFASFQPTLNFPSEYYARLNWETWYENGGWKLYAHTQAERMRRFMQYAGDKELQKRGVRQLDLPIEMYVAQQQRPRAETKAPDVTNKPKSRKNKLKQLDLF